MLYLSSARADARSLVCALTVGLFAVGVGATGQAHAEGIAPLQPTGPAGNTVSDAVLRSAVARTDFSALALVGRNAAAAPTATPGAAAAAAVHASTPAAAVNGRDLDCMTQAVFFEARGEPSTGQAAVAQVVMNRVRHPAFPKSVCGVVFQRAGHSCQFSWACRTHSGPGQSDQWRQARAIASRVLAGEVIAGIGFATHFNGARAGGFGRGLQRVAQIGQHAFYKFSGSKGAPSMFNAPVRMAQAQTSQPAPHAVYASLLPLPTKAEATRMLASATTAMQSASTAMHSASSAVQKVVIGAAQSAAQNLSPKPTPEATSVAEAAPSAGQAQPATTPTADAALPSNAG